MNELTQAILTLAKRHIHSRTFGLRKFAQPAIWARLRLSPPDCGKSRLIQGLRTAGGAVLCDRETTASVRRPTHGRGRAFPNGPPRIAHSGVAAARSARVANRNCAHSSDGSPPPMRSWAPAQLGLPPVVALAAPLAASRLRRTSGRREEDPTRRNSCTTATPIAPAAS